ncbi:MAG: hypothetical protein JSR18_10455 [Proteobacteria bacterium]|nr:hypothetical protein [Pseudomonadota bacterium]
MKQTSSRARLAALALASALTLAACAPDTVSNKRATGFDAYLNTLRACHPLQIGSMDLSVYLDYDSMGDTQYLYFMDQTSKLYYNRVSYAQYRESMTAFFGAGTSNQASFDCIFNKLPPDRPLAPPGAPQW